ncbi:unnamed protein product [Prorocentrum cordatum]|uniref:Uncharacterized protein n=1 Tax=Prorocentrum cordatum TaxID=2364126 RepID=A0ABN9QTP9_9DINO|nr:unnamed protein product [Polarella glacialis]
MSAMSVCGHRPGLPVTAYATPVNAATYAVPSTTGSSHAAQATYATTTSESPTVSAGIVPMSAAEVAYAAATVLTSDFAATTGEPLGASAAALAAPAAQRDARHTVYVEHSSVSQAHIAAPAPLQEVFPKAVPVPVAQQVPQAPLVRAFSAPTPVDTAHLRQVSYPAPAHMGYTTMAVQYAMFPQDAAAWVGQLHPLPVAAAPHLPPLPQVFPQHHALPQGGLQPGAPRPAAGVPAETAKAADAAEGTEGPKTSRKHTVVSSRHKAKHCC